MDRLHNHTFVSSEVHVPTSVWYPLGAKWSKKKSIWILTLSTRKTDGKKFGSCREQFLHFRLRSVTCHLVTEFRHFYFFSLTSSTWEVSLKYFQRPKNISSRTFLSDQDVTFIKIVNFWQNIMMSCANRSLNMSKPRWKKNIILENCSYTKFDLLHFWIKKLFFSLLWSSSHVKIIRSSFFTMTFIVKLQLDEIFALSTNFDIYLLMSNRMRS